MKLNKNDNISKLRSKHYYHATKNGNVDSIAWLDKYYKDNGKNNEDQMVKIYTKAANNGDINSIVYLIKYYIGKKDIEKTISFCNDAINIEKYDAPIFFVEYCVNNDNDKIFENNMDEIRKFLDNFVCDTEDDLDEYKYEDECVEIFKNNVKKICEKFDLDDDYYIIKKMCKFAIDVLKKKNDIELFKMLRKCYTIETRKLCEKRMLKHWEVIENREKFIVCDEIPIKKNGEIKFKEGYIDSGSDLSSDSDMDSDEKINKLRKKRYDRAYCELEEYYTKKNINFQKYENLVFWGVVNRGFSIYNIFKTIDYHNEKCVGGIKMEDKSVFIRFVYFLKRRIDATIYGCNEKRCFDLLKILADKFKSPMAIYEVGKYYENNDEYIQMKDYYNKGIELNEFRCAYDLAFYYDTKEKNYVEALKLYKIAYEGYISKALLNIMILCKMLKYDEKYEKCKKVVFRDDEDNMELFDECIQVCDAYGFAYKEQMILGCQIILDLVERHDNEYYDYYTDDENEEFEEIDDKAKLRLGTYYEYLKKDYDKAEEYYNLIKNKGKAKFYIKNFEKKNDIIKNLLKNKIMEQKDCDICCVENDKITKLECCSQEICYDCIRKTINESGFKCPYCRNENKIDEGVEIEDDDEDDDYYDNVSVISEYCNDDYIDGIYYGDGEGDDDDDNDDEDEDDEDDGDDIDDIDDKEDMSDYKRNSGEYSLKFLSEVE